MESLEVSLTHEIRLALQDNTKFQWFFPLNHITEAEVLSALKTSKN